jgi:hypothetical protein
MLFGCDYNYEEQLFIIITVPNPPNTQPRTHTQTQRHTHERLVVVIFEVPSSFGDIFILLQHFPWQCLYNPEQNAFNLVDCIHTLLHPHEQPLHGLTMKMYSLIIGKKVVVLALVFGSMS